jgi:pilus assembly protein CpaB
MKPARILVLVVALASGGVAAWLAQDRSPPPPPPAPVVQLDTVDVLVASTDIGLGQTLSGQNLAWQTWPASVTGDFIQKTNRPNAIQDLIGARVRSPVSAGEPIREAKLVRAGKGFLSAILPKNTRAVAVEISPENGAGGFILPGDHVDVILTRTPIGGKGEEGSTSETILTNVQVLAIDLNIDGKAGQNSAIGKIATLELTPTQAQTLVLARRLGTIALVLRSLDDVAGSSDDDAPDLDKRQTVNIVRYGVSSPVNVR